MHGYNVDLFQIMPLDRCLVCTPCIKYMAYVIVSISSGIRALFGLCAYHSQNCVHFKSLKQGNKRKESSNAAYLGVASLLRTVPARHRIWDEDRDRYQKLLVGILTGETNLALVCGWPSGILGRMALFVQILLPGIIDPLARLALTWKYGYIKQNAASPRAGFEGDTLGCTDEAIAWLVLSRRLEGLRRHHVVTPASGPTVASMVSSM